VYQDPATAPKKLGAEPFIHPTAQVRDSSFGAYCEVGARTKVSECSFGDYSYIVADADIIYATVGKFCSIAAHTRINPGNHPLERVALNHFTYRSSAYGLGEDDADFFQWRRDHHVTLGNDVWIGHGAILLPGVSVGNGAAIGAGAVVSSSAEVLREQNTGRAAAATSWSMSHMSSAVAATSACSRPAGSTAGS
jgi:phosphonate metabolism protein (transferase hexapeptide repeat family)